MESIIFYGLIILIIFLICYGGYKKIKNINNYRGRISKEDFKMLRSIYKVKNE